MLNEIGVTQVTIPLPFRLNHVHCFLAEGSKGWTIMDTGLHREETSVIWKPIIEKHPIKEIILTHYHPDHYGYAGALQQLTGADVWMTAVDENAGTSIWEPASIEIVRKNYQTCGLSDEKAKELSQNEGSFNIKVKPYPKINHHLEEGMNILFGKYEYEVIFTPGHSDGLITLFNTENSILFSTDHILPRITPNISYWFRGISNPLEAFFTSLKKIEKLDAEYVIPSHGEPFRHANQRIKELLVHHHERLNDVLEYIKDPATIYQVSTLLFKKKLTTHEMRFAIGETLAHLEYLYHNGQCKKFMENGVWYYERS
ncbi:MBL fold metallo-hydrolase [Bacillus sp. FJAT-29790]|uniref:MBL fold metallo-hydrolase n=1 Tax=Bacillus sp. FJAT-29790 TaxID=1895002 RepID=UPI001C23A64E|nr:MBL fold metallo-hydrolase [Bacillus sp. FJAT-29790]MBU8878480.1 MBL fold metallo-hydrolase [Bacillus sp. FJAT-29790]